MKSNNSTHGNNEENQYDVLKDIDQIIKGNFPKMRKMKRRLRLEMTGMMLISAIMGWLDYPAPLESVWFTVPLLLWILAFLVLQRYAFRAYWYVSGDPNHAVAFKKMAMRTGGIASMMTAVNISLAAFILFLLYVDTLYSFLTWPRVFLLFGTQLSMGIFSARWIAGAKAARKLANDFEVRNVERHDRAGSFRG